MVHFLHLPANVLRLILSPEAIDYRNFVLCRDLLPYTLAALYCDVRLRARVKIRAFAASLIACPSCLASVKSLHISEEDDAIPLLEAVTHSVWDPQAGTRGAGQFRRSKRKRGYDPSKVVLGPGLLQDLVYALPNLSSLQLCDSEFYGVIGSSIPSIALVRVRELFLGVLWCRTMEYGDSSIFRRIAGLPSLQTLTLSFSEAHQLALPILALSPNSALPPRTFRLVELRVFALASLGPEIRQLFAYLDRLERLQIVTPQVFQSLPADLALLPSTLTSLKIVVGGCTFSRAPLPKCPKLGSVLSSFPSLLEIQLSGSLADFDTLDSLADLPVLRSLSFGPHVALQAERLLAFLDPSNKLYLSRLESLEVNYCHCLPLDEPAQTLEGKLLVYRNAPRLFQLSTASTVVEMASKVGVKVSGHIVEEASRPVRLPPPRPRVADRPVPMKSASVDEVE